jgi:hypothetical protein
MNTDSKIYLPKINSLYREYNYDGTYSLIKILSIQSYNGKEYVICSYEITYNNRHSASISISLDYFVELIKSGRMCKIRKFVMKAPTKFDSMDNLEQLILRFGNKLIDVC